MMRETATPQPNLSRCIQGSSRLMLDVSPANLGMWGNAQVNGDALVPVNAGAAMSLLWPPTPEGLYRYKLDYQGTVANTWPPPSPGVYRWDQAVLVFPAAASYPALTWYTTPSASTRIRRYILESLSQKDFCDYADYSIRSLGTPSDLRAPSGTLASRLANCPNLLSKLQNGGSLKLLMMGDSFQNGNGANSGPLIRRSYPKLDLHIWVAAIGSHGAEQWVAQGQTVINSHIQAADPDVVCFGGISSLWVNNAAWLTLVDMIRVAKPGVEIILASEARGDGGHGSAAIVSSAAMAKGCVFFDAAATMDNWITDSGWDQNDWLADGLHYDMRGWLVVGRGWAWFLGATKGG